MLRFIIVFATIAIFLMIGLPILSYIAKLIVTIPLRGISDYIYSAAGMAILMFVATAIAGFIGAFLYIRNR